MAFAQGPRDPLLGPLQLEQLGDRGDTDERAARLHAASDGHDVPVLQPAASIVDYGLEDLFGTGTDSGKPVPQLPPLSEAGKEMQKGR